MPIKDIIRLEWICIIQPKRHILVYLIDNSAKKACRAYQKIKPVRPTYKVVYVSYESSDYPPGAITWVVNYSWAFRSDNV